MASSRNVVRTVQVWVQLRAEDPEAVSALAVARSRLPAAREIVRLNRLRVFELHGLLPARSRLEELLHRSIQFYNPHKERCTVRYRKSEAAPVDSGDRVVLVTERGGARRPAAERWWRHETGQEIEVREGVAWAVGTASVQADAISEELAVLRDRRHGLLCNPKSQEIRVATAAVPLPWFVAAAAVAPRAVPRGRRGGP